MRPPSFKTRLWLGQVGVLAAMLALAALGADWALRRVVFGETRRLRGDVPRLFQRFYRGKASHTTDVPGGRPRPGHLTGAHRAPGRAASGEKGATFTVRLPRA